jgi:hypothetical protein
MNAEAVSVFTEDFGVLKLLKSRMIYSGFVLIFAVMNKNIREPCFIWPVLLTSTVGSAIRKTKLC